MKVLQPYKYVGPTEIAARTFGGCGGSNIDSVEKLREFLCSVDGYQSGESLTVTFVVGTDGRLRIANRRSEHVACAKGDEVLSAGEMTFGIIGGGLFVEGVTNQSTGYCPEPESWAAVAGSLDRIPIEHPDCFDPVSVFRRCPSCSQINIVKDEWYVCGVCQATLPTTWNFARIDRRIE